MTSLAVPAETDATADAEEAMLWRSKSAASRRYDALATEQELLRAQLKALGRPDDAELPLWAELSARLAAAEAALAEAREAEKRAADRWYHHRLRTA
jgi:hypothetical protein